mmetsp:Transcript_27599/g.65504  ORF Transcript_27599/g.65504 Transcript_27599/m.65504 type:complete len:403 (+) Transcript_27599:384-1592(+)
MKGIPLSSSVTSVTAGAAGSIGAAGAAGAGAGAGGCWETTEALRGSSAAGVGSVSTGTSRASSASWELPPDSPELDLDLTAADSESLSGIGIFPSWVSSMSWALSNWRSPTKCPSATTASRKLLALWRFTNQAPSASRKKRPATPTQIPAISTVLSVFSLFSGTSVTSPIVMASETTRGVTVWMELSAALNLFTSNPSSSVSANTTIISTRASDESARRARLSSARRRQSTPRFCTLRARICTVWTVEATPGASTAVSSWLRSSGRSSNSSMHAWKSVSPSSTEMSATLSCGTSKAAAIMLKRSMLNSASIAASPLWLSSSLSADSVPACSSTRRRLPEKPSSMATSAHRTTRCEIVNCDCPPVCVGLHSYPGLIQYARMNCPLSWYLSATRYENWYPRSLA